MHLPVKLAAILALGAGTLGVSACATDGHHGRGHGLYHHDRYDHGRYDRHDRYHDRRDHRRHRDHDHDRRWR